MTNGTEKYIKTVEYLGKLYDFANEQLFDGKLVRPVITVQADEKNKTYGWFTTGKVWKENADDEGDYEINMSAQQLHRPVKQIAATMIHEMCHQYAKVNNLQDCSRSGTYHNKLFKKIAENHGLHVEYVQAHGWAVTTLTEETDFLIDKFITDNPDKPIYRTLVTKGQRVKTSSTRKYVCPCCRNSVRATKDVNIICADCNEFMCEE